MAATPIVFALSEWALARRAPPQPEPVYDNLEAQDAPVIICGFGRMGQIVGRVLRMQGIRYTALEQDPTQVDVIRRFGAKVYYGDPGRADLLRAAGADTARLLVVALSDPEDVLRVVDVARRSFPGLRIVARARNRRHAHLLMERDVGLIVRETFHSALRMTEMTLRELGRDEAGIRRTLDAFTRMDEQSLAETMAIRDDETALIQSTRQLNEELATLFSRDRPAGQEEDRPAASRS